MNQWQILAWQAAVFGGLLTAFLAVLQAINATRKRSRDLRWKKAEVGRDLLDGVLDQPLSNAALLMLDSDVRDYKIGEDKYERITAEQMLAALHVPEYPQSPAADFVRDAFDTLYYYLDRFEHFIEVELTSFDDVKSPLDYYVGYLAEDKQLHLDYIRITRYTRVVAFLDRFDDWKQPKPIPATAPSVGLPPARMGIGASAKVSK